MKKLVLVLVLFLTLSACDDLPIAPNTPKGTVCTFSTSALVCTNEANNTGEPRDFKIPYPIASTQFNTPPLNFIAVPIDYLERLKNHITTNCKGIK
jgi:hypothetical protein